jgi:hypothetical protein
MDLERTSNMIRFKFTRKYDMKKTLLIMALVVGVALVTSGCAQKWDLKQTAEKMTRGCLPFKFTGEIQSIDPIAQTAVVKVGNRTYTYHLSLAKYEGGYSGIGDLKVGDVIKGTGMMVTGEDWVSKVAPAGGAAFPGGTTPSK